MILIDLAERRALRKLPPPRIEPPDTQLVQARFSGEGRALADLAHPIIEPFRQCEPTLEQHLKGAFLRWQVDQIKRALADDPHREVTVGIAMGASVEGFTDRMIELQGGAGPDGGRAA